MNTKLSKKKITCFFCTYLMATIFLTFYSHEAKAVSNIPEIKAVYFYNNPCESCGEEEKFREEFYSLVDNGSSSENIKLFIYNTFNGRGNELSSKYFEKFNVPEEKRTMPILFIGDTYVTGREKITSYLRNEFNNMRLAISNSLIDSIQKEVSGKGVEKSDTTQLIRKGNDTTIIYFHTSSCTSCDRVDVFLNSLEKGYSLLLNNDEIPSNLVVKKYNIADFSNLELIKKYFKVYGVTEEEQKVPIVFIGDTYLSGEEKIKLELANNIKKGKGLHTSELVEVTGDIKKDELAALKITGIIFAGFINGVNPCSVSMFLFFLSMLVVKNINILKLGFSFILGKFIAYFLLGTLMYRFLVRFNLNWINSVTKILLIIIVLSLIIMNLLDCFAAKNEKYNKIRLQLPSKIRRFNHTWIKKMSLIGNAKILTGICFILGILISAGEFLCTGQVYLATIVYIVQNSNIFNMKAATYFLLYDLAFVTPLLLLMLAVIRGREIFDVSELFRSKMHIVKMANAVFFTVFAVVIIIWF